LHPQYHPAQIVSILASLTNIPNSPPLSVPSLSYLTLSFLFLPFRSPPFSLEVF
jgi:hypothetical protein